MLQCRTLRVWYFRRCFWPYADLPQDRGNSYICALCRHHGAARPSHLTIRSYSSDPKSSSHAPHGRSGGLGGGWSSSASSAIPRRTSGPSNAGWGAPAFGASNASAVNGSDSTTTPSSNTPTDTSSTPSPDDGLLPHERAARQRLAAQRTSDSEPTKPAPQPAKPHQHRTPPHKQEGLPSLGRRPRQHFGSLDDSIGRTRAGPRPVAPIPHRSTPRAANPMGLDEKPGLRGSLGGLDGPPGSSDPFARLADSVDKKARTPRARPHESGSSDWGLLSKRAPRQGPRGPRAQGSSAQGAAGSFWERFKDHVHQSSGQGAEKQGLGDAQQENEIDYSAWDTARGEPEETQPSAEEQESTLTRRTRSTATQGNQGKVGVIQLGQKRGAHVTDIVVLVVAADDSVKPQTLEAIKHARAAKVPMIVAINKVDKEDARVDQVKSDLARHGVEIEDFGGDVQVVCVSGKTGQGMDDLEENIATLSEILDVRAEADGLCEGWVLEASVKQDGKAATVLVKRGTLRPGDSLVAGTARARVRLLRNEAGVELAEAPPGTPVEILGWRDELPAAGDAVLQAPDEERARKAVEYRTEMRYREESSRQLVEQEARERERKAAEEATDQHSGESEGDAAAGGTKTVTFTVRGDVVGSVEAVCATIQELGNHEVKPRILRSAVGQVSESDVEHAATSGSVIVNFNAPVAPHIKRLADAAGVRLIAHSVIYHLADEVRQTLSDQLADVVSTKVVGEAEVLQIFPINTKGRAFRNIAGCKIRNGLVSRTAMVRVLRRGETVFEGKIDALKHGKKDVTEMRKGTECGISFEGYQDFQVGDQVQTYEEVREKRTL
ncbi:translation initiation factor IF-2 [Verticillium dahliae VdLs.17]|uniref:Translation initiation factor IF-2, mitochondrial n=1 Tax=Verticillium dahliae (strain VdLs.17 / ATCC MYA-4575 / FGSC 10137) TaxID=498257 RepID=G2XH47_VERDV|nr:translation initiation factor IF-2 [Verticillium dahliae VdLs.17]EGY19145.1 translation initiation factor IF-2 [Verticillium dahliae VdLs.17]